MKPQGGAVAVPVLRRVVERRLEPSAADVKIGFALLVDDLAGGLGLAFHRLQRLLHPNRTRGEDGVPARALIWQHKLRHVGKGHPRHRQHVGERPCGLPSRIVEPDYRPTICDRLRTPPVPIRVHGLVVPVRVDQDKREADPAAPGHVAPLHRQDMPPRTFQLNAAVRFFGSSITSEEGMPFPPSTYTQPESSIHHLASARTRPSRVSNIRR